LEIVVVTVFDERVGTKKNGVNLRACISNASGARSADIHTAVATKAVISGETLVSPQS
jgi:hypothetical protein